MGKILISGGSGLIGSALTNVLLRRGYQVAHLSRTKDRKVNVKVWQWDLGKQWIEEGALADASHIIHLAGANIGDEKHNAEGKKRLVQSRVTSSELLYKEVKRHHTPLRTFISASAIGYYGMLTSDKIFSENDKQGSGFIPDLTAAWENTADKFEEICRVVKIRIGLVLDKHKGALPKIATPTKLGLGAALGNGKQWMPWIHKNDLCKMICHLIEHDNLKGVFNGVAPDHVTNSKFISALAKELKMPYFLPGIPRAILELILGEKAALVLNGSRVSSEKIMLTGFRFDHPDLKSALKEIYSRP